MHDRLSCRALGNDAPRARTVSNYAAQHTGACASVATMSAIAIMNQPPRLCKGRFRFLYLSLLIASAVTSEASAQTAADSLGVTERVYGLSLIWKEAAYNFPYFDQLGALDWDEAYHQFVPRVVAAGSTLSYYRELQRFMALLHDGHSRVQLPDTILQRHPFSSPWVELRAVGGRPMVANVATILVDSLPLDSEVIAVEGLPVDRYLVDSVLPYVFASAQHSRRISAIEGSYTRGYGLLVGPAGSHVRITARTPAGELVRLTLFRDRFEANREWALGEGRAAPECRFPLG